MSEWAAKIMIAILYIYIYKKNAFHHKHDIIFINNFRSQFGVRIIKNHSKCNIEKTEKLCHDYRLGSLCTPKVSKCLAYCSRSVSETKRNNKRGLR